MRRALFAALAATLTLTACNEHEVDECLPRCGQSGRDQERFAQCVADGSDDCRPGNRRCCALDVGCVGELGDQSVVGPDGCLAVPQNSCLPDCDDVDQAFFEDCLDGAVPTPCFGDAGCCAVEAGCLGTLGDVAVYAVDRNCCDDDTDCLRDEICDVSNLECVTADCAMSGFCPVGLECVDAECVCPGEGAPCDPGEYCIDDECVEDPCLSCPAGSFCGPPDFECATCATDDATCDLVDDDCDGFFDENFVEPSVCGLGLCQNAGTITCVDGVPVDDCTPNPPLSPIDECGAVDDDCDGTVDEDCGVCDNGVAGGFEECDGMDLQGETCMSQGFDRGMLGCFPMECVYDYELCTCDMDADMDGDCDSHDCAPMDARRGRFNLEQCDLIDNDCDGFTDELPEADESCDDFLFCTGVEMCSAGSCDTPGMNPCDDGNDCTRDPCDEMMDSCPGHPPEPSSTPCFDSGTGMPGTCDGAGTCIPGL